MSEKRLNSIDNQPMDSSSEEDEVETSSGESEEVNGDSSSEEEVDESSRKPASKKPETVLVPVDSGSEEESDHDSETERKDHVKNLELSVSKSVVDIQDSVVINHESEKGKSSAAKKRSYDGEASASTDAKKVKRVSGEDEKKSGGGGDETKKTYFQRIWTEEDEIAVLKGIIDYEANNKVSPFGDLNVLYQSLRNSICFDATKNQFVEKLRNLKKKFENNLDKGKNGEEPTFSKPHDQKAFDLSKFIWGANGIAPKSAVKSNGKSKKSKSESNVAYVKQEVVFSLPNGKNIEGEVTTKGDTSCLIKSLARFGMDDLVAQQGWTRLALEDQNIIEDEWKTMIRREIEFYSQKSGFLHGVVTKMAKAFLPTP